MAVAATLTTSIPTTTSTVSMTATTMTTTQRPHSPPRASSSAGRLPATSYLTRTMAVVDCPTPGLPRFVILDCPTDSTLPTVHRSFVQLGVTDVVRVCEPTYATATLAASGIAVHDLPFADGGVPPAALLSRFLAIATAPLAAVDDGNAAGPDRRTVAVHCIAGLGRAPLMIAVALIELAHLRPLDAIEYVRARRRGAFNTAQVKWLDAYKPGRLPAATVNGHVWSSSSASGGGAGSGDAVTGGAASVRAAWKKLVGRLLGGGSTGGGANKPAKVRAVKQLSVV
ncbi:protein-tyrosine phosphatase-like protein [Blastocladiella britannica]|nr:protein-tyrosine phosphatase-like protein [Blastocladiella britannica]